MFHVKSNKWNDFRKRREVVIDKYIAQIRRMRMVEIVVRTIKMESHV